MSIEKTDHVRSMVTESTIPRDVTAQKVPEKQHASSVLTADPKMLLKRPEAMTRLTGSNAPELTKMVNQLLLSESEEAVVNTTEGNEFTDQSARLTLLMANVAKLAANASYNEILSNLNARITQYQAIASSFKNTQEDYDSLVDKLKQLNEQLNQLVGEFKEADKLKQQAETTLKNLIEERQKYQEGSEKYAEISEKINAQQIKVNTLTVAAQDATSKVTEKYAQVLETSNDVDAKLSQLTAEYDRLPLTQAVVNEQSKMNAIGTYISLLMEMLEMISDNNVKMLDDQRELNKILHEQRIEKLTKQAEEISKKTKANTVLKKIVGVFGTVVGAVVGVLGIVTAIPTGGATSPLAIVGITLSAISLTLLVADTVCQIATNYETSVTSVISEKLSKAITSALISIIVKDDMSDKQKKDLKNNVLPLVANILSTIITLAPSIVGLGCMIGSISRAAKGATDVATQAISKSITRTLHVASAAGFVQTLGTLGFSVSTGLIDAQISRFMAGMTLTQNDIDHVTQLKQAMVDQIGTVNKNMVNLQKELSNILDHHMHTMNSNYSVIRNSAMSV